jgi:hypothetical protein
MGEEKEERLNMKTPRICKQCRQPLPENGPEGVCPACLAQVALGAKPDPPAMAMALFSALAGALTFLLLQWHFSHSWASYYSHFPWTGYERAMKDGNVPASMTGSPRSLLLGEITLSLLSFAAVFLAGGRIKRALGMGLAFWAGTMVAIAVIWVITPQFRNDSNMWPIDLIFVAFLTGVPVLAGGLLGFGLRVLLVCAKKRPMRSQP